MWKTLTNAYLLLNLSGGFDGTNRLLSFKYYDFSRRIVKPKRNDKAGLIFMEIKENRSFNQVEIVNLYKSVGWTNYLEFQDMLEKAYENSLCV